jgi:two-component system nitrogen regulation response regulator NtrX
MMNLLIVEDQDSLAASIHEAITKWNHKVEVSSTAHDALRKVREKSYDLVLLDLFLPEGMVGHALIPEFKALHPHMGIVTMTGYNSRELELEIRKHGIFCYLTKPFSLMVVKEIIDHVSKMKRKEVSVSWLQ